MRKIEAKSEQAGRGGMRRARGVRMPLICASAASGRACLAYASDSDTTLCSDDRESQAGALLSITRFVQRVPHLGAIVDLGRLLGPTKVDMTEKMYVVNGAGWCATGSSSSDRHRRFLLNSRGFLSHDLSTGSQIPLRWDQIRQASTLTSRSHRSHVGSFRDRRHSLS